MSAYPANLCTLPQAEQDAIERDRAEWFRAWKIHRDTRAGRRSKADVRAWLETLDPAEQADLRRRLNTIDHNQRKRS